MKDENEDKVQSEDENESDTRPPETRARASTRAAA